MKIGFFGIGPCLAADPDVIKMIATTCEDAGYYSLWCPEHILLLDDYAPKYPYTQDGVMPFPSMEVDLLDPFVALSFAAAVTSKIRLGTGICLVPERHPMTTAKEVASLDKLSNGRFDFGVGIGWLKEEFEALQIPWEKRASRTRDYLAAMKELWTTSKSKHDGDFCAFPEVRSYPKPVQKPYPPVIFGGESDAALKRVGQIGDGWWGVNVTLEAAEKHIKTIAAYATEAGRDPAKLSYAATTALGEPLSRDLAKRYEDAGIDQMIVGGFGASSEEIRRTIEQNAETLIT